MPQENVILSRIEPSRQQERLHRILPCEERQAKSNLARRRSSGLRWLDHIDKSAAEFSNDIASPGGGLVALATPSAWDRSGHHTGDRGVASSTCAGTAERRHRRLRAMNDVQIRSKQCRQCPRAASSRAPLEAPRVFSFAATPYARIALGDSDFRLRNEGYRFEPCGVYFFSACHRLRRRKP